MEMEKINKKISTMQERQEEIKKITQKKEQEQNKKEYEKGLLIACEQDLKNSIDSVFQKVLEENNYTDIAYNTVLMQYYNINTRNACIAEFGKTTLEQNYLEKNYNKILKEISKKWENHVKYCQVQELIEQQKQEEQDLKFENGVKTFFNILKWIAIIIFIPIFILFKFLYDCSKEK